MTALITIKINKDVLLNILEERLEIWEASKSPEVKALFLTMYENYIDNGVFDEQELDPALIVDDDVVNWCAVVKSGDEDFNKLLELYKAGEYDVSCEHLDCGASFIEAVSDNEDLILIRR